MPLTGMVCLLRCQWLLVRLWSAEHVWTQRRGELRRCWCVSLHGDGDIAAAEEFDHEIAHDVQVADLPVQEQIAKRLERRRVVQQIALHQPREVDHARAVDAEAELRRGKL